MTQANQPIPSPKAHRSAAILLAVALILKAAAWAQPPLPLPLGLTPNQETYSAIRALGTQPVAAAVPAHQSNPPSTAPPPAVRGSPTPCGGMGFLTLGRVTFESGKWNLSEAAQRTLHGMAAYLAASPGATRLLLDGHTDGVGSTRYNDTLSDKRAAAVAGYLIGLGVDPQLIHWRGHGKRAPADEDSTRLGRRRNRHVEVFAIYLP